MAFLDVLAVVALGVREPEEPLLEDRVPPVPERHGEAQPALPVRDPEEPVLAPAVGPRARVLVGEVAPALAVRRVVLPHRAPLALGKVGSPALPVPSSRLVLVEAGLLGVRGFAGHGDRAQIGTPAAGTQLPPALFLPDGRSKEPAQGLDAGRARERVVEARVGPDRRRSGRLGNEGRPLGHGVSDRAVPAGHIEVEYAPPPWRSTPRGRRARQN